MHNQCDRGASAGRRSPARYAGGKDAKDSRHSPETSGPFTRRHRPTAVRLDAARPTNSTGRVVSPAPGEERHDFQGHPRTAFRRSLARGNLVIAELEAREVGAIDLSEALELTALVACRDRLRGGRYAVRWLQRWLEETPTPTIHEAAMVASCLSSLGGPGHAEMLSLLR